jgi:hypothetical protein
MSIETITLGGRRIFIVGPPQGTPESPSGDNGRRPSGALRAVLSGIPIPREEARALRLHLNEVEAQCRSLLADCVVMATGLEVILCEVKDAQRRLS